MSKFNVKPDRVAICVLMYGTYIHLHKKIISSLVKHAPKTAHIYVWCNQVGPGTLKLLHEAHLVLDNLRTHVCHENPPKYHVMRSMLDEYDLRTQYDWLVWFDDDSEIVKPDWWPRMVGYIRENASKNIAYIGARYYIHHRGNQWDFIQKATWFKGLPSQTGRNSKGQQQPAAIFATGGYWWLRMDALSQLDWPDRRLEHNGGDTLLGVAMHQNGFELFNYPYGVNINKAPRRGRSDRRAGE